MSVRWSYGNVTPLSINSFSSIHPFSFPFKKREAIEKQLTCDKSSESCFLSFILPRLQSVFPNKLELQSFSHHNILQPTWSDNNSIIRFSHLCVRKCRHCMRKEDDVSGVRPAHCFWGAFIQLMTMLAEIRQKRNLKFGEMLQRTCLIYGGFHGFNGTDLFQFYQEYQCLSLLLQVKLSSLKKIYYNPERL